MPLIGDRTKTRATHIDVLPHHRGLHETPHSSRGWFCGALWVRSVVRRPRGMNSVAFQRPERRKISLEGEGDEQIRPDWAWRKREETKGGRQRRRQRSTLSARMIDRLCALPTSSVELLWLPTRGSSPPGVRPPPVPITTVLIACASLSAPADAPGTYLPRASPRVHPDTPPAVRDARSRQRPQ